MSTPKMRRLAHELSNALEIDLDNGAWSEIIHNLRIPARDKTIVRQRLRWTIIDEKTGENLLEIPK